MDDILTEAEQLKHGILHEGRYYRDFILAEDTMEYALKVSNDSTLDWKRMSGDEKAKPPVPADETYYSAAVLAKRLTVEGVENVTPEQILNLSRADGQILLRLSAKLEDRRELFRSKAAANAKGHPCDDKAGLPGGGSPPDEPGEDS